MTRGQRIGISTIAILGLTAAAGTKSLSNGEGIDASRIAAVAAMLPERPAGFGRPMDDRQAWEGLSGHRSYRETIFRAQEVAAQPIPDSPDDLYMDFSRTGNRRNWERVSARRRGRIEPLVLAECMENKGRFLAAFEETVRSLCDERTWVMPAHDRSLRNFKRSIVDIDLGSAMLGWRLATARYLLGARLNKATRRLIRDNVRRRVLDPFRAMAAGKREPNWWMSTTNNWNAVCLACVTGSALTLIESRQDRAFFVAAAETYSKNFLRGFTGDGYCSEGVGYWNFGFGHYVLLAEVVHQATRGGVDLFERAAARQPATYGARVEIIDGVYPAFADCSVRAQPSPRIMRFLSRRYALGLSAFDREDPVSPSGSLYEAMMYSFPNSASRKAPAPPPDGSVARSWFEEAGVLICRPGKRASCRLAAALKGGHNAEHHNHNDVGSYVVVVAGRPVLVDPGAEVYTARTFSSRRYESKVLNSYGHPVPMVAGRLQKAGSAARGRVLRKEFAEEVDSLVLDISSAYDVPELKKLERTFVYSREDTGSLTVIDEVVFASPRNFETALITLGSWKQRVPGKLAIFDEDSAVSVDIEVAGSDFDVEAEQIKEDVRTRRLPTRLGIHLRRQVTEASVRMRIRPMASGRAGEP